MNTAEKMIQSTDARLPAQLAALECGIPLPLHNKLMEKGERSALARKSQEFHSAGFITDDDLKEIAESLGVSNLSVLINDNAEQYWQACWNKTNEVIGLAIGAQVGSLGDKPNATLLSTIAAMFTALCASKEGDTSMASQIGEIRAGSDTILGEIGKALAELAQKTETKAPEQAKEEEVKSE